MDNQYPFGLTVDSGRYRLDTLFRGTPYHGLWRASHLGSEPGVVLVTFRRLRYTPALGTLLRFSAPGIAAPLYLGMPDPSAGHGKGAQQEYFCVVDEQPSGIDLDSAGRLTVKETAELGVSLCETITGWAAALDGTVTRGLRPETIFVTGAVGERRFSGATPRTFFLLGDDGIAAPYSRRGFDPPSASTFQFSMPDALFTVALILWHAVTGVHPYRIPGTDLDRNIWFDRRVPFDGPQVLGAALESALVADPAQRISVDAFRARLREIAASGLL